MTPPKACAPCFCEPGSSRAGWCIRLVGLRRPGWAKTGYQLRHGPDHMHVCHMGVLMHGPDHMRDVPYRHGMGCTGISGLSPQSCCHAVSLMYYTSACAAHSCESITCLCWAVQVCLAHVRMNTSDTQQQCVFGCVGGGGSS